MEIEVKWMTDDALKIIRILGVMVIMPFLMEIITYIMCIIIFLFISSQTYFFIQIFELKYFMKYAPLYFASIYALISLLSVIHLEYLRKKNFHEIHPNWAYDFLTPEVHEKILKDCKLWVLVCLINLSISLGTGALFATIGMENAGQIFYPIKYFLQYNPDYAKYFHWVYMILLMYYSCSMTSPLFLLMHFLINQINQMYLFNIYLQNITKDYEQYDVDILINDGHYQEVVYRRLLFVIDRYSDIYHTFVIINEYIKRPIVAFFVGGNLMGIAVVLYVYVAFKILGIVCILGIITTFILTFMMFIQTGELIFEQMHNTFDVAQKVLWYTWNKENKQMYQIFLLRASKPITLCLSENIVFNYEIGVQVVKTLYSVSCVMAKLL